MCLKGLELDDLGQLNKFYRNGRTCCFDVRVGGEDRDFVYKNCILFYCSVGDAFILTPTF